MILLTCSLTNILLTLLLQLLHFLMQSVTSGDIRDISEANALLEKLHAKSVVKLGTLLRFAGQQRLPKR